MYVKLNKEDIGKCEAFANECVGTNNYARRGQKNVTKRIADIIQGKMAELAVAYALTDMGMEVTAPDFEVYTAKNKKHGTDLLVNGKPVEIKSQAIESMKNYGASWLLEKRAIEKIKDHLFIFCTIIDDGVLINNICLVDEIEFGSPKLIHLKTKAAIYYEDVLKKKLNGMVD